MERETREPTVARIMTTAVVTANCDTPFQIDDLTITGL